MKRKVVLILSAAAALLQWGCMDYKEFSDAAVDPFQPTVVIPVAADTAYANDALHSSREGESILYHADGSVYIRYETHDSVAIDYELATPKLPTDAISLTKDAKSYDVKEKFQIQYNIAGIVFSKVTINSDVPTALCGSTNLNTGDNVFAPAQDGEDALTLHFVKDGDKYHLTSSETAQIKFSDYEIKRVILATNQDSKLFVVKKALGRIVVDMFEDNIFAHHDFSEAKFMLNMRPYGKNIPKLPFQFALTDVMSSYSAVDPVGYDGHQQVQPKPDRMVESKSGITESELVLCKSKADNNYPVLSSMPSVEQGTVKTFEANGQNSNIVELLVDGPKYVDFGVLHAQYNNQQPLPDEVTVDLKSDEDYVLIDYVFELPLKGEHLESLWESNVLLKDSLPDLNSNEASKSYSKVLNLQDDDYVKLYLQFVNRLPFDIFANVEFQSLDPAVSPEIIEQMRLDFNGIESIGGNENLSTHFKNPEFKQFLAVKAAPVDDKGKSTGESRNVVTCLVRYSQYKVIQQNAEALAINYRLFNPDNKPYVVDKDDFIYVRVGVEAQPTISYNPRNK